MESSNENRVMSVDLECDEDRHARPWILEGALEATRRGGDPDERNLSLETDRERSRFESSRLSEPGFDEFEWPRLSSLGIRGGKDRLGWKDFVCYTKCLPQSRSSTRYLSNPLSCNTCSMPNSTLIRPLRPKTLPSANTW